MSPSKLTEADKQTIIDLYRQPGGTTADIADHYGVSTTTISRILKQGLSAEEYEELIQQKRAMTRSAFLYSLDAFDEEIAINPAVEPVTQGQLDLSAAEPELVDEPLAVADDAATGPRRVRKRSSASSTPAVEPAATLLPPEPAIALEEPVASDSYVPESTVMREIMREELLTPVDEFASDEDEDDEDDLDDDEDDLDDLDDDEDDDDEDDDDDLAADGDELPKMSGLHVQSEAMLQILPLSEAPIPRTFYLVVDRAAELITRPLRDFADLGQIPENEIQARTLPIFDNHRVAKRFLRRSQRVVKIPDGRVLPKVSPYLQAKGITRLLIDGQIYSLSASMGDPNY